MANGERATRTGPPLPKLSAGMAGVLTLDFLLLWSGQTVSIVGTQVSGLALPLLALALSLSPAQAGAIAALRLIPYLALNLPTGALLDRWNRKRATMVASRSLHALVLPEPASCHELGSSVWVLGANLDLGHSNLHAMSRAPVLHPESV